MKNFYCPKCLSSEIYISKKGFDVKKGVMGTILSGDLLCGAITGSLKKDELECTCLKCGHKFTIWQAFRYKENSMSLPNGVNIDNGHLENIKHYRCICGKEASLDSSSPYCPKCGRRMTKENEVSAKKNKKGCTFVFVIILNLISCYCIIQQMFN